ncbi:Peptidyl-prolyl cis-trans isomerase-like 3 [Taphrina deformans PYCC 5710]|uniref:Peptidyl-prolyl cis-trans isomerase n=1 Tax=Taphrina deformans (strain PYCC 5710 / ATCC 11124 / CBS 356.35 / IMI 108563 / JCM 9778 / NBRC 8474) TaxID=1097556 RepID=R4X8G5_TAPDE|nr:Peptidyl-prolyl cis-trans isomerase-like 3 [Taphrina deformans PYCC 5710]|eukprot:CCG81591.1 Peptidyl-prolyl cis-trans isomerase-like 3 [Taphrina deformans PYCC 5710]
MSVTLHTEKGDIKLELFCNQVPKGCENFLALCAAGSYDGAIFHRNIRDFMVQVGIPNAAGVVKKGMSIWGGKFEDEIVPELRHDRRGIVSWANSGPNTNGSQFFVTYKRHEHLDGQFTVFGRVIDGIEVLDDLEKVAVNEKSRPLQDIKLKSVTIHANPIAG